MKRYPNDETQTQTQISGTLRDAENGKMILFGMYLENPDRRDGPNSRDFWSIAKWGAIYKHENEVWKSYKTVMKNKAVKRTEHPEIEWETR